MKIEELLFGILEIVKESHYIPFDENADWNMMSVAYSGDKIEGTSKMDLKNNPHFTIYGKENVEKYNSLYKELLAKVAKDKEISLDTFKQLTQNLIFENSFTIESIKEIIDNVSKHKTIEFFKVYGLKMEVDVFEKGKFTFVNRNYIKQYIIENAPGLNIDSINNKFSFSVLDNSLTENTDYVFVAIESISYDDTISLDKATQDVELLLSAINFMFGLENCVSSITSLPVKKLNKYQLNIDYGYLNSSGEMFYTGSPIIIDKAAEKYKWHSRLWDIISLQERNELEKRIIKAIEWTSKAFVEKDENIKRVEIAFAFEALLQSNSKEMIKESITALLSEQFAFINGKDLGDRKEKEKDFRDFYRERSGIAHGGRTHYETNVNNYFMMIISTIYHLLTDEHFKNCKTGEDVATVIKDMKYRNIS